MDLRIWCQFTIVKILLLFCIHQTFSEICTPGLDMPGYTVPQGDITIEEGSSLDITCVVNSTNNNASLYFKRNAETISPNYTEVLNSSSIKLHYPNPPLAAGDTYTCLIQNDTPVCMNRVIVGKKPQEVTDFECVGYNFDNFTCTWTAPENYVRTEYYLNYTVGEARSFRSPMYECPYIESMGKKRICFWNVSTTPAYRQVHEFYNFTLTMHNALGSNQITKMINHFAHVLSGPPQNLTAINTTLSSIYLYWVVPLPMQTFPPGVHHRILYQCEYGEKKWHLGGVLKGKLYKEHTYFNLTDLKYAHALCDIRVSLRSAKALHDDYSMWSRNASITVRTGSKVPDLPPETNIGSFEVVSFAPSGDYRDVYIYWKQIAKEQMNGPDFRYKVVLDDDESLQPCEKTSTYAKFSNISIARSYTFSIWSENINGTSSEKTTVFVPKQSERLKEPSSFIKVESREGEYELAWDPPKLEPHQVITNYTIFTCINDRERPYQCTGELNWIMVPGNETSVNMTVDEKKVVQFAISANTYNSSSGMLWAACTIIRNKSIGKMNNVWVNKVGSTFIEMGWKLDCSDRIGSVESYMVYYCPIKSPTLIECKGPLYNITFNGSSVSGGNITGLNPYTTYRFTVSVITKHNTFSQQSDPIFNTTLESAPSPPSNLKILSVTNSSISMAWTEPEARNGILRFYEVKYINTKYPYNPISEKIEGKTHFTIPNLISYENYSVSVSACTIACSESSAVTVTTEMGYPSQIDKPTVDRRNHSTITIVWNRPSHPGGKNDNYVVRLKQKHTSGNQTSEYNTTARKFVIENCGDGRKFNTFYVSVKAVNQIGGKRYEGPWSDELENYCDTPVNNIIYAFLIIAIAIICFMGFLSTRLYYRCKIMRDVEVKLPPGLAPVVADHTLKPWSIDKHQEIQLPQAPPDEELLLEKISEEKPFSGDSSGCSSGHESVTSSLESATHISSSSDSGTYIPFSQTEPVEPIPKSSGYVVAGVKNINGYVPCCKN